MALMLRRMKGGTTCARAVDRAVLAMRGVPSWSATAALVLAPPLRSSQSRALSATAAVAAGADRVLLLGSGNVVRPLVDYLGGESSLEPSVTIGSVDTAQADALAATHPRVSTLKLDVTDGEALAAAVKEHDVVISLVPWQLHPVVAQACIDHSVNMVTTSYVSDAMAAMHDDALAAGITILNEIGVDPGIDHLGAMRIIDDVKDRGGKIKSFISFCGGLPAAESSFGPLHYKFSWFPKGVLVAGMSQATYRCDGQEITTEPGKLFSYATKSTAFPTLNLEGYPNRNSIQYEEVYGIEGVDTILRGTLRFEGFCHVMECMRKLGLFDETPDARLEAGAAPVGWADYMSTKCFGGKDARVGMRTFLKADGNSAEQEAYAMSTFERLGLFSPDAMAAEGNLLDALCQLMTDRLAFEDGERDMLVMSHDFLAEWADGTRSKITSTLVKTGAPQGSGGYTAMAETVGMPCALAVELVLKGGIPPSGVIRPVAKEVYVPLLEALAGQGIEMVEEETKLF